jgi:hypothetical protein
MKVSSEYESGLEVAKKGVIAITQDPNPILKKFESKGGYEFLFATRKGDYSVSVDQNCDILALSRVGTNPAASVPVYQERSKSLGDGGQDRHGHKSNNYSPGIDRKTAGEKALQSVGGKGTITEISPKGNGYEVELNMGRLKGRAKVFVDGEGNVTNEKKSRFSDMMDGLEFD